MIKDKWIDTLRLSVIDDEKNNITYGKYLEIREFENGERYFAVVGTKLTSIYVNGKRFTDSFECFLYASYSINELKEAEQCWQKWVDENKPKKKLFSWMSLELSE